MSLQLPGNQMCGHLLHIEAKFQACLPDGGALLWNFAQEATLHVRQRSAENVFKWHTEYPLTFAQHASVVCSSDIYMHGCL